MTMKSVTVPYHSFLAILDRELRRLGFGPRYALQVYRDTLTRKKKAGIVLRHVEGKTLRFDPIHHSAVGILGFVNGEEPGEGSIPLHQVHPQVSDRLAIAFILQGIYKGNFAASEIVDGKACAYGEEVHGLQLIHHYTVQEEDMQKKLYEIPIEEYDLLLSQE